MHGSAFQRPSKCKTAAFVWFRLSRGWTVGWYFAVLDYYASWFAMVLR